MVDISAEIAEEEESKKRRLEKPDAPDAEPEMLPSVRAALYGKRKAEEEPDDPRSGTWQNVGEVFENEDDVADLFDSFGDFHHDHDAPNAGGATSSSSGAKRPAEDPADDRDRGDHADEDKTVGGGDDSMIGIVEPMPFTCSHCSAKFRSRNIMFKHLYQHHDDDGQGAEKKLVNSTDLGRFPTSRLTRQVKPKSVESGIELLRPVLAVEDFRGHPSPIMTPSEIDPAELRWKDIGSGIFARTFRDVSKLPVTSSGGPLERDVYRRVVRSLSTGKVIDDCIIDDVSDQILRRSLPSTDNVRVELIMRDALGMYQKKGADVVELYSQPRIAQEAAIRKYGGTDLTAGWSLDLTMRDPETNSPWDLSKQDVQNRVRKMVTVSKPFMLVGSPPCTPFSRLQALNSPKRDPKVVEEELAAGRAHMNFCFEMYELQRKSGRFFAHEHPSTATSWSLPVVLEMLLKEDVDLVEVDMCDFGMKSVDDKGEGLVRKRTKILTNSQEVAKRVARRCAGGHRHVNLIGGRAKRAQLYPRAFSRAFCEGVAAQKRLHALGLRANPIMSVDEMTKAAAKITGQKSGQSPSESLHEDEYAEDDQSGGELVPELVRAARKSEIDYFRSMGVYDKVPEKECWDFTGCAPISVRWVDINKGDSLCPNYRSRLVAREFNTSDRPEWYAATPPSETLRIILSKLASDRKCKLMYADVSRAYFYAPAVRPVYVQLAAEDRSPGDEGLVGRLKMSMYGTRDAAANWAAEYGATLIAAGYVQGVSSPCVFHNAESNTTIMVHGDDFVGVGRPEELGRIRAALEDKYKLKVETLSGDKADVQEVKILNKIIRWTERGIELEADPRHAEIVVRELGLEGATPSKIPGVKVEGDAVEKGMPTAEKKKKKKKVDANDGETRRVQRKAFGKFVMEGARANEAQEWADSVTTEEELNAVFGDDAEKVDEEMSREDAKKYRGIAARLNYLSPDRMDIGYAVKEAARNMSKPLFGDWAKLKRIGRYLLGRPRLVSIFAFQAPTSTVTAYTDSDWAGCKKTGRSTSGGIVTVGSHIVKSYSRQQKTVALSSAEAELHAMVAASAEALGIVSLLADMGVEAVGEVYADSSAALGIAQRQGMGKVRHIRTQALWVQEVRATGRLAYKKVLGSRNPADILTKHVASPLLDQHLATVGVEVRGGRADSAPTLDEIQEYTESAAFKEVRFSGVVNVRPIPAVGRGRPTKGHTKLKWTSPTKDVEDILQSRLRGLHRRGITTGDGSGG